MNPNTPDLSTLFSSAGAGAPLSKASMSVLGVPDLGARIRAGLGIPALGLPASEVFLLTVLIDDSGSIRSSGNEPHVIDGYNSLLAGLRNTASAGAVLVHTRFLNGTVHTPFTPIAQAAPLTPQNYQATGGTPLFDESTLLLGTVLAKTAEFEQTGVPVRSLSLVLTDGQDCHSQTHKAKDVKALADDLRRNEGAIFAGFGFDNGDTDFRKVFRSMGVPDEWILTSGATPHEIRAAFRMISVTAARASISAPGSLAGFGG